MKRRLGKRGVIGKCQLRSGKGKKFRTYPKGFRATEKKGEGERGLGRALPFLSLCTLGELGRRGGRSPALVESTAASNVVDGLCV